MRYVNNKRNRSKIRYAHSTNTLPLSISPFIRLWELAAEGGEGRRSTELCLSFSKSCLIPILDWLDVHNVPDGAPASSQQPLIKYLEATVVANVILPGRGAYLNANRPEKARNPDIPTTMLADLLAPLRLVLDDSKLKEVGEICQRHYMTLLDELPWFLDLQQKIRPESLPSRKPRRRLGYRSCSACWLK